MEQALFLAEKLSYRRLVHRLPIVLRRLALCFLHKGSMRLRIQTDRPRVRHRFLKSSAILFLLFAALYRLHVRVLGDDRYVTVLLENKLPDLSAKVFQQGVICFIIRLFMLSQTTPPGL